MSSESCLVPRIRQNFCRRKTGFWCEPSPRPIPHSIVAQNTLGRQEGISGRQFAGKTARRRSKNHLNTQLRDGVEAARKNPAGHLRHSCHARVFTSNGGHFASRGLSRRHTSELPRNRLVCLRHCLGEGQFHARPEKKGKRSILVVPKRPKQHQTRIWVSKKKGSKQSMGLRQIISFARHGFHHRTSMAI
jgi:hypothetical protein